ncbi:MAG: hypothetical protein ABIH21_04505 [Patescibacteria group bacterium]
MKTAIFVSAVLLASCGVPPGVWPGPTTQAGATIGLDSEVPSECVDPDESMVSVCQKLAASEGYAKQLQQQQQEAQAAQAQPDKSAVAQAEAPAQAPRQPPQTRRTYAPQVLMQAPPVPRFAAQTVPTAYPLMAYTNWTGPKVGHVLERVYSKAGEGTIVCMLRNGNPVSIQGPYGVVVPPPAPMASYGFTTQQCAIGTIDRLYDPGAQDDDSLTFIVLERDMRFAYPAGGTGSGVLAFRVQYRCSHGYMRYYDRSMEHAGCMKIG